MPTIIAIISFFILSISASAQSQRPQRDVSFKYDFCVCKDATSLTMARPCVAYCANQQTNGEEILFVNFLVSPRVQASILKNVYGWCTRPFPQQTTNPKCVLEAKDRKGNVIALDVQNMNESNSITANVSVLSKNLPYTLTLRELTSGARSNSVDLVKY